MADRVSIKIYICFNDSATHHSFNQNTVFLFFIYSILQLILHPASYGYTGDERWAIITELSVKKLWEKYPLVIERYSPFVHLSIAQGEVIDDTNRNEDKYAKRSSRTLDCYGYDDEMSSQFHKELAIMFDDPFERAEEERLTLQTSTSRQKQCFLGW